VSERSSDRQPEIILAFAFDTVNARIAGLMCVSYSLLLSFMVSGCRGAIASRITVSALSSDIDATPSPCPCYPVSFRARRRSQ